MWPLEGIRIIDLTQVWAGPLCTRLLADFGAEVIKIESIQHPDRMRYLHPPKQGDDDKAFNRGGYFHQFNRNKFCITLDLRRPAGKEVFLKLVKKSDVVVENYALRVQQNLGITYPELRKVKADLIMLSMHGYGSSGPYKNGPAFGSTIEAMAGMKSLLGYGDGVPIYAGACIGDPVSGFYGAVSILAALASRRTTGEGQFIDLSMHECVGSIQGEAILEYTVGKREPLQLGSRHRSLSPYGCYPCKGEDSWVAICVTSETEWEEFCNILGEPDLRNDLFADPLSRYLHQDELDPIIAAWTRQQDAMEVTHRLQEGGIPAGAFLNGMDILANSHLKERGYFWDVDCPDTGRYAQIGPLMHLSGTPAQLRMPPPGLGEHNTCVLGDLLGMTSEEIRRLEEERIIGERPDY
jgi:crotonobetainyl-CoA:carnitine CoA-transferase CaiB-like acyl-CoA transferase